MQLLKTQLFQIAKRKNLPVHQVGKGEGSLLKQNFTQRFDFKLTSKFQALENGVSGFSNCTSSVVWPEIYHFSPFSSLYPLFVEEIQSF